jgi:hypothetical protein
MIYTLGPMIRVDIAQFYKYYPIWLVQYHTIHLSHRDKTTGSIYTNTSSAFLILYSQYSLILPEWLADAEEPEAI